MSDEWEGIGSGEQRRSDEARSKDEADDELSVDEDKAEEQVQDTGPDDEQRRSSRMSLLTGDDDAVRMFGGIHERRVTFCVDTSATMYDCLDTIKDQLINVLERRAGRARDGDAFNVVEFSTNVIQWADELVAWTPATVAVASDWIRDLHVKTGTNTCDAVVAALADPTCDAVYLVTDSIPDQPVDDVLDAILRAAGNRPVHCRYIQRQAPDPAALSFLRDLAMETFGSLLIVSVSAHGNVLDVAPVYRAESTAERIVRTTGGNVFPSGYRMCSVGTSLDGPPPTVQAAVTTVVAPPTVPPWPYCLYPWPYRYYYTVLEAGGPAAMRWRPGKAWMKHTREFADHIVAAPVPGAGSMLVGARVLARRHRDGFFYMGTVKSQILDNQFLVEFGPCKHGKFSDTEYQETYVYDIVSHSDALRHPVMVGDNVLAPWEPEGERYAPAIVISGLEKRMADGGGEDQQLVATFHDGKTVSVAKNKAMWIPRDLYERTLFEIGLPKNVRQEFATQDFYPYYTSCGYPSSGSLAFPAQFDQLVPQGYSGAGCRAPVSWGSGSCRGHPWMTRSQSASAIRGRRQDASPDYDEMIPGTDLTKSQLNSKVMAQIMQNKLGDWQTGSDDGRLLKKRATDDNTGILKKSVSFIDVENGNLSDSGHGSQVDLNLSDVDDDVEQRERDVVDELRKMRDAAVGTRSKCWRTPRRPRTASPQRRMWRYWNNDPAPSMTEPKHYGPYREGPYDDCLQSISTLLRDAKKSDLNAVEWTSPINRVVDAFACYKYSPGVKDCLGYVPVPPSYKPGKQQQGRDPSELTGTRQMSADRLAEVRRAYRQRQVLAREIGWQRRVADEDEARRAATEVRRQRVSDQLDRDRARVDDQRADAERRLEAKRQLRDQLEQRFRDNADEFGERQARRIAALTEKRTNRNMQAAERAAETAETHARRQAAREVRNVARMETHMARISEQERQAAAQHQQKVGHQVARDADFRRREKEKLQQKQREADIVDQQRITYRAQVLP